MFAGKAATAWSILEKLQDAYDNLPNWLKMGVTKRNKSELELQNGSRIIAGSTAYMLRGMNYNIIFLDEFAFVSDKDAQDFVDAVLPVATANKSTKVIIASSIKQQDDCFSKIWKDSEDGKNRFVRTIIKWDEIPGRNNEWKQKMIANIGINAWNQEYECKFLGS